MKYFLFFASLFFLCGVSANCQDADTVKYTVLSPVDFRNDLKTCSSVVILDVRKEKDYKKSHIPGSLNIPWPFSDQFFDTLDTGYKTKSLYLYCYAGYSSRKAAEAFYDHGYRNIYSLEGGFMKWRSEDFSVTRRKTKVK